MCWMTDPPCLPTLNRPQTLPTADVVAHAGTHALVLPRRISSYFYEPVRLLRLRHLLEPDL